MTIKTIPRSEFDRLVPYNPSLEGWMVEQVEWFSNRSGTMLGTIAKGERLAGWNYAILKQGKKGDFRVHKVMNNFFNLKATKVDLLLWMSGSEKLARIDLLLSMAGCEKSDCANSIGLLVDRACNKRDILPAV